MYALGKAQEDNIFGPLVVDYVEKIFQTPIGDDVTIE